MDARKFTVCGVVLIEGQVLLVRHTYGIARGQLLLPGGHCHPGEMPMAAVEREIREETGVKTAVRGLMAAQFKPDEWMMVFLMDYLGGTPRSDQFENSEVLLLPPEQAILRSDITQTSRAILQCFLERRYTLLLPSDFCPDVWSPEEFKMFGV